MMLGMLITSILSGQLISRYGRYRIYPIIGTAVMALGLFLFSTVTEVTSMALLLTYIMLLGMGLGFVMQVLIVAVQNAAPYSDLGVATSGATLFRLIGGSVGTSMLGAIFAARLGSELARAVPGEGRSGAAGITVEGLTAMEPALRAAYMHAFTVALSSVFFVAAIIATAGFAMTWFIPELPLRKTVATAAGDIGHEASVPFSNET
jgi:MFS family permease